MRGNWNKLLHYITLHLTTAKQIISNKQLKIKNSCVKFPVVLSWNTLYVNVDKLSSCYVSPHWFFVIACRLIFASVPVNDKRWAGRNKQTLIISCRAARSAYQSPFLTCKPHRCEMRTRTAWIIYYLVRGSCGASAECLINCNRINTATSATLRTLYNNNNNTTQNIVECGCTHAHAERFERVQINNKMFI